MNTGNQEGLPGQFFSDVTFAAMLLLVNRHFKSAARRPELVLQYAEADY